MACSDTLVFITHLVSTIIKPVGKVTVMAHTNQAWKNGQKRYEQQRLFLTLLMACSLRTESYIANIHWIQKYVKGTMYERDTEKMERIQSIRTTICLESMACERGARRFAQPRKEKLCCFTQLGQPNHWHLSDALHRA